jgi:arylsulfatase A-like enzyme
VLDGLRAGYDAEIRYMDRHLGRLLQAIEASPRANETLVVITADHGESFGEHYFVSHGAHLYEDNVRVPLVMRGAGVGHGPGTRIAPAVQNHRVFASILDAVDLELPPGVVLAPLGAPGGVVVTEVKRSESNILFGAFFDRDLRTILVPPLKLIESTAAAPELFHIEHDPAELADLAAVRAADVRVLAARLEEIARLHPPLYDAEARAVLEPDTEDALRALGYIE